MRTPIHAVLLALPLAACGDAVTSSYHPSADTAVAAAATPRAGTISGTIAVPDVDANSYACVFLMGRRESDSRFPELVKKLPAGPFPMAFELSARDLVGVGSLRGEWHLTARLDRDGDALATKGDREGELVVMVDDATPPIALALDRTITEDAISSGGLDLSMGGHGGAAAGTARGIPMNDPHGGLPPGHPPLTADPHAGHDHAPGEGHDDPHAGHDHGPGEGHDEEPAAAEDGPRVTAVIELPDGAEGTRSGVLFFFARANAATGGMPLAVRRVDSPTFPVTLELTAADVALDVENKEQMMDRTLYLSASLDADGNASTKTADDLVAGPIPTTDDGSPTVLPLLPREAK